MAKTVFMKRDGVEYGPFEFNEVQDMLRNGGFKPEDQMRGNGDTAWKPAGSFLKTLGFSVAAGAGGFLLGTLMSGQTAQAATSATEGASGDINPTLTGSWDVDGDGVADVEEYDLDGDGVADVAVLADRNGDGIADAGLDTNGDGVADVAFADTDGDGWVDTQIHDVDHDRVADMIAMDTNGDGIMDTISEIGSDGEAVAEASDGIFDAIGEFFGNLFG